jgi:hypothetical protein
VKANCQVVANVLNKYHSSTYQPNTQTRYVAPVIQTSDRVIGPVVVKFGTFSVIMEGQHFGTINVTSFVTVLVGVRKEVLSAN